MIRTRLSGLIIDFIGIDSQITVKIGRNDRNNGEYAHESVHLTMRFE